MLQAAFKFRLKLAFQLPLRAAIQAAHLRVVLLSLLSLLVWLSTLTLAAPAHAFETLEGQFRAERACPALQSIKKKTNPGAVQLELNAVYNVIGKNRRRASHYMLQIPEASPTNRWVEVNCGRFTDVAANDAGSTPIESSTEGASSAASSQAPAAEPAPDPGFAQTSKDEDFLLALSWQPSFCETRPNKPECTSQTDDRFDASHLVLHGLWPQPRGNSYCGVSDRLVKLDKDRRWLELPPLELAAETRSALEIRMPGMASGLHRHEWYKHGTCYSNSPEEYYQESISLLDQVNQSSVRDLMVQNIDFLLTDIEIQQEFDAAFGQNAGNKVAVKCKRDIDEEREIMIVELWVNLKGKIEPNTVIANLLKAAPRARRDCRQGEIDPAGFGNG